MQPFCILDAYSNIALYDSMEDKFCTSLDDRNNLLEVYKSTSDDLVRYSSSEARALIDSARAFSHQVLPLGIIILKGRNIITIAVKAGASEQIKSTLKFITGMEVRLVEVSSEILREAILKAYMGDDNALQERVKRLSQNEINYKHNKSPKKENEHSEVVPQFINTLISYAFSHGASDVHVIPRHDGTYIYLRINGELVNHATPICSLEVHKRIISCIKILGKIDISKKNCASDGSCVFAILDREIQLRISTIPTIHGEKVVLRLHGCNQLLPLETIGLDLKTFHLIKECADRDEGLIIFCGPTGSGKSTTMYSLLEYISRKNRSVVTVEDPVELQLDFASQTDISKNIELDYSSSVRALLRQDPDCIMLGEIRDASSAKAAIEASLTGHLVVSSLHAGDVFEALARLRNLGIDSAQLIETCRLIVSQRLLPKLCMHCRVIDLQQSQRYERVIYRAVGCNSCDYTGFSGRILCCEALYIDMDLREGIQSGKIGKDQLLKLTNLSNYIPYVSNLIKLAADGVIELNSPSSRT